MTEPENPSDDSALEHVVVNGTVQCIAADEVSWPVFIEVTSKRPAESFGIFVAPGDGIAGVTAATGRRKVV